MNDLSAPLASALIPRAPVAPSEGRFICLGPGGRWARTCINTGTLRFGAPHESHDLALKGDWEGARDTLRASGTAAREVGQLMRELRKVYTLGPDCRWITLAEGRLWWGFTEPEVIDLRMSEDGSMGVVARRIIGGWSCHSIFGDELLIPACARASPRSAPTSARSARCMNSTPCAAPSTAGPTTPSSTPWLSSTPWWMRWLP